MTRYTDPAWLEDQYWGDTMSLVEIGEKADVSPKTIQYWMDRNNIPRRPPTFTPSGEDAPRYVPPDKVLDDLIAGYVVMGKWPSEPEYESYADYCPATVRRRFDSFGDAREAAKDRYAKTKDEWPAPGAVSP